MDQAPTKKQHWERIKNQKLNLILKKFLNSIEILGIWLNFLNSIKTFWIWWKFLEFDSFVFETGLITVKHFPGKPAGGEQWNLLWLELFYLSSYPFDELDQIRIQFREQIFDFWTKKKFCQLQFLIAKTPTRSLKNNFYNQWTVMKPSLALDDVKNLSKIHKICSLNYYFTISKFSQFLQILTLKINRTFCLFFLFWIKVFLLGLTN